MTEEKTIEKDQSFVVCLVKKTAHRYAKIAKSLAHIAVILFVIAISSAVVDTVLLNLTSVFIATHPEPGVARSCIIALGILFTTLAEMPFLITYAECLNDANKKKQKEFRRED